MLRGCKIRIYPTAEQKQKIWNHIHASRFIWNYMVELQRKTYEETKKTMTGYQMVNLLKPMRNTEEYSWLKKVSNTTLKNTCLDLAQAYHLAIIGKCGFPNFKSKKYKKLHFPTRSDYLYFENGIVVIEKVGRIKYKSDLIFQEGKETKFYNARVMYEDGKFFVSFSFERENQTVKLNDRSMGIDVGVKNLATVAYGDNIYIYKNINKTKRLIDLEKKASDIRRCLTRKYRCCYEKTGKYSKSNNIVKLEAKHKKIINKIKNIKKNYYHHATKELVSRFPERIVMEDLVISEMAHFRKLRINLNKQNLFWFYSMLKYKCEDRNISFVYADRYFPSSKTCSFCGFVKRDLKLSDRVYKCNKCGAELDRDINAARNLMMYQN